MLKHLPFGLGHPYRTEPFERSPHYPIRFEPVKLRVCTEKDVKAVFATFIVNGKLHEFTMTSIGNAISIDESRFGITAKELTNDSHLTDAAARSGEYSEWMQWEVEIPGDLIQDDFEYYFSSNETSVTYSVKISEWTNSAEFDIQTTGDAQDIKNLLWLVLRKCSSRQLGL